MKKIFFISTIILTMLGIANAVPAHRHFTGNETGHAVFHKSEEGDGVTGEISDSHCRFKHMDGMESAEVCVHHCQGTGAKVVLIDREKNLVYTLDEEGQKTALKFAGRKVKVTGHVMESMIHVEKIEAAE